MQHYSLWSALLHGTIMTFFSMLMITAVYAGPLKMCGKCNTMVRITMLEDKTFACSHCNSVIQSIDEINKPLPSLKAPVTKGLDPHSIASQITSKKLLLYSESQAADAIQHYPDSVKNTHSNLAAADTSYEKHEATETEISQPVVVLPLPQQKKIFIKFTMHAFDIPELLCDCGYKIYSPSQPEQKWYNDLENCFLSYFNNTDQLENYLRKSDFAEMDQSFDYITDRLVQGNVSYFVITTEYGKTFSLFGVMVTGTREMVMFIPGDVAYQASQEQSLVFLSMLASRLQQNPFHIIKVYQHENVEVKKKPSKA